MRIVISRWILAAGSTHDLFAGASLERDTALRLYVAHRRALIGYARTITGSQAHAEDLVQEAWVRFDEAMKGRFLDNAPAFLYRIVRNLALDGRRRDFREKRLFGTSLNEDAAHQQPDATPSPEAALLSKENYTQVMAAMAELPERTRIALEMHRIGGATLREIAEFLNISVSLAHILVIDGVEHCKHRLGRG